MKNGVHEKLQLVQSEGVRVVEFSLAPGAAGPWHSHSEVDETCYALSGQIQVDVENQPARLLLPGERIQVAARTAHRVRNRQDKESSFLIVQAFGEFDFVEQAEPAV